MRNKLLLFIFFLSCSGSFGQKNFSVKIDPRIEALSIFFTLATVDTFDVKPSPSVYYKSVKNFFEPYKDHPSLNWYRQLDSWDGYDMPSTGLFLSEKFPFEMKIKPEIKYIRSVPPDTFLRYFNQFYEDSNMKHFIKNNRSYYEEISEAAKDKICANGILETTQQFFDSKSKREIILYADLLNNHGNNAITSDHASLKEKVILKLGYINDEGLTDDSAVIFNPKVNVVAHECSHIYLHQFFKKYHDRLYAIRDRFLVTGSGKVLKEAQWENEIEELVVRACVARILANRFGNEAGEKEIKLQTARHKWVAELYHFLSKYNQNRNQFPAIEAFYPQLIEFLENETKA